MTTTKKPYGPRLRSRVRNAMLALTFLGGAFLAGATTSCDAVDNAFDCQAACTKYRDCFDGNFDVGACRDRCRSRADNSDTAMQQADACENCIDGRSCPSATVACSDECGPLIAP